MQHYNSPQTTYTSYFSHAVAWNALLFIVSRTSQVICSYGVYYLTNKLIFFQWSHSLALIYLILLWIDFGFKKSIAFFAQTLHEQNLLKTVLLVQLAVVGMAGVGLVCCSQWLVPYLSTMQLSLSVIVLCLQGALFAAQNIYHAYFFNKVYNRAIMAGAVFELIALVLLVTNRASLEAALLGKIIASAASLIVLLKTSKLIIRNKPTQTAVDYKNMITHTGVMGLTTVLKSLSERNFLLPFFAAAYGVEGAILYKLANETALFFYRVVIKSLGSADTALLARAQEAKHARFFSQAVLLIQRKIVILIVPLAALFILSYVGSSYASYYAMAPRDGRFLSLVRILIISYLGESFLISYERVLEVKQEYRSLLQSYVLYAALLGGVLSLIRLGYMSMIGGLVGIQAVRMVGLVWMYFRARTHMSR
jgi:hypothetical protein